MNDRWMDHENIGHAFWRLETDADEICRLLENLSTRRLAVMEEMDSASIHRSFQKIAETFAKAAEQVKMQELRHAS